MIPSVTRQGTNFLSPVTFNATTTMKGHLLFSADNTYDIGASGATRPRTLYLGTSLSIGGLTAITNNGGSLDLGGTALNGVGGVSTSGSGANSMTMSVRVLTFSNGVNKGALAAEEHSWVWTPGTHTITANVAAPFRFTRFNAPTINGAFTIDDAVLVKIEGAPVAGTATLTRKVALWVGGGDDALRFGTRAAITSETLNGYITIRDDGGTLRKLAVVA